MRQLFVMKLPLVATALLVLISTPLGALAQKQKPKEASAVAVDPATVADRILLPAIKENEFVGMAVGVVKDGKVVVRKGYGARSLTAEGVPDADTIFYIGSLSKAVTAVGFMRLVDQGKASLSDPIGKYLKGLPKSWNRITIAQVMSHQSGIPQLEQKLPTFEEMLVSAQTLPLTFPPGTKQEYNNFNFAITGKLIEAISGMKYLDYMKQEVFGPLGMTRTGNGLEDANEATSYRPGKSAPQAIDHRIKGGEYGIPSGHLQSTVNDLLRLYEGLRRHALFKAPTMQQMITRVQPNLSGTPGWFESSSGDFSIVCKNGAGQGVHSLMTFVARRGQAAVLLWTSQKPGTRDPNREMKALLNQICGIPIGPNDAFDEE